MSLSYGPKSLVSFTGCEPCEEVFIAAIAVNRERLSKSLKSIKQEFRIDMVILAALVFRPDRQSRKFGSSGLFIVVDLY